MIYISQGHEKGIGLEIFFKSVLSLSKANQNKIFLAVEKKSLEENLKALNLSEDLFRNITIFKFNKSNIPVSTDSLNICLSKITPKDILITLPTSKDQLVLDNNLKAGYTEYFRSFYNNKNISMVFKSYTENVLLLSDHISLNSVSKYITNDLIENKLDIVLNDFIKYFHSIDEVYFAGINPHAGENGLIGSEEFSLQDALQRLRKKHKIFFSDFLSGDTLHIYKKQKTNQLFVYPFHDQALAKFKSENGFVGLNLTFGLPFLRLSVDHGTAFNMYGKNCSNISGMIYLFKIAIEVHSNVNK